MAFYGAETWKLRSAGQKYLENSSSLNVNEKAGLFISFNGSIRCTGFQNVSDSNSEFRD
jgi:hypothetical protein